MLPELEHPPQRTKSNSRYFPMDHHLPQEQSFCSMFLLLYRFIFVFSIPCRFSRPSCAYMVVMKKYIITLVVAATSVVHTQAAELASQLLGYWQPDIEKNQALAKKENREIDPAEQAMMGNLVFEFQKDTMICHGPPGHASYEPAVPYKVKGEDKAANSLTLSVEGEEMKIRFDNGQMAMKDPENGWINCKRISKEDFAKREGGGEQTQGEDSDKTPAAGKLEDITAQPIPDKPAAGKVHGKIFKIESATLEEGCLKLWQGEGFSTHLEQFEIDLSRKNVENFSGKTFAVELNQKAGIEITIAYSGAEKGSIKTSTYMKNYTMKLEFGTAKDGKIPGKIHLRLPDEMRSFVLGTFEAEMK